MIAAVAALALALAGLLPAPHVHDGDGERLVHQHAIADGAGHHDDSDGEHHGGVERPDHTTARILTLSFEFAGYIAAFNPTHLVGVPAPPADAEVTPPIRSTLLPTHDPPLRFVSSPAPPSAA
ncbi:MAG: hypothetical protein AB7P34_23330 [Vicinamibacterales bacterium]